MSLYYKPLDNINVADIVTFNSIAEITNDGYQDKPQRKCQVVVNGEAKEWGLSLAKVTQLTDAGFKQGDTCKIQKWKEGIKKGYNFVAVSSTDPYSKPPTQEAPILQEVPKDDIQERIIRGMCFNNATALIANNNKFDEEFEKDGMYKGKEIASVIGEFAKALHEEMSDWLRSN